MPAGVLVTEPPPAPLVLTVNERGANPNEASTDESASIVNDHVPVPEHAPDHPVNAEPASASAVSVTTFPWR